MKLDTAKFKAYYNIDNDIKIDTVCSLNKPCNNALCFANKLDEEIIDSIKNISLVMFVTKDELKEYSEVLKTSLSTFIPCENPRLEYVRSVREFFHIERKTSEDRELCYIHKNSVVHKSVILGPQTYIGPNCLLEKGVEIAAGVKIIENVTIKANTTIGPGTVIGSMGFGVERDEPGPRQVIAFKGKPMKMPHLGGILIDSHCNIGALNTLVAGAIDPTYVGKYVQTDDHVHIAHNCHLEEGVLIAASATLSGSVKIGKNSWIGVGSTIMQKVEIGKRNTIGLGAAILKSTGDDEVWAGNPGRLLKSKN